MMWRRGFAVLLTLALLLTAAPLSALAAESVLYGETGDAVVSVRANNSGDVTVSASELERAAESGTGSTPVAEIRVRLPEGAVRMTVALPVEALETLGASGAAVSITSALAGVKLDSDAMASLAYQAAGETVILTGDGHLHLRRRCDHSAGAPRADWAAAARRRGGLVHGRVQPPHRLRHPL